MSAKHKQSGLSTALETKLYVIKNRLQVLCSYLGVKVDSQLEIEDIIKVMIDILKSGSEAENF